MTTEEKIIRVQTLLGADEEATDALIGVYLDEAKSAILNRRYPFGVPYGVIDVPEMYESLQCRLATRYFLKRGAEGEQIHNEDGVHRHYGSVQDEDLLMEIIQIAKVQ